MFDGGGDEQMWQTLNELEETKNLCASWVLRVYKDEQEAGVWIRVRFCVCAFSVEWQAITQAVQLI